MRLEPFFDVLAARLVLDRNAVRYFAADTHFNGGWEIWLQCCIGFAFFGYDSATKMTREAPYPSGQAAPFLTYDARHQPHVGTTANTAAAARADFLIERPVASIQDSTYLELKCRSSQETMNATWTRFTRDKTKIEELGAQNRTLNCIALLATWGVFSAPDVANFRTELPTARALDFADGATRHTTLGAVAQNGADRLFLIGVPEQ